VWDGSLGKRNVDYRTGHRSNINNNWRRPRRRRSRAPA